LAYIWRIRRECKLLEFYIHEWQPNSGRGEHCREESGTTTDIYGITDSINGEKFREIMLYPVYTIQPVVRPVEQPV